MRPVTPIPYGCSFTLMSWQLNCSQQKENDFQRMTTQSNFEDEDRLTNVSTSSFVQKLSLRRFKNSKGSGRIFQNSRNLNIPHDSQQKQQIFFENSQQNMKISTNSNQIRNSVQLKKQKAQSIQQNLNNLKRLSQPQIHNLLYQNSMNKNKQNFQYNFQQTSDTTNNNFRTNQSPSNINIAQKNNSSIIIRQSIQIPSPLATKITNPPPMLKLSQMPISQISQANSHSYKLSSPSSQISMLSPRSHHKNHQQFQSMMIPENQVAHGHGHEQTAEDQTGPFFFKCRTLVDLSCKNVDSSHGDRTSSNHISIVITNNQSKGTSVRDLGLEKSDRVLKLMTMKNMSNKFQF